MECLPVPEGDGGDAVHSSTINNPVDTIIIRVINAFN